MSYFPRAVHTSVAGLALVWILTLLLVACGSETDPQAPMGMVAVQTPPPFPYSQTSQTVIDAVALLRDNKARCMRLLRQLEAKQPPTELRDKQRKAEWEASVNDFFDYQAVGPVAASQYSLELVDKLLSRREDFKPDPLHGQIDQMNQLVRDLCDLRSKARRATELVHMSERIAWRFDQARKEQERLAQTSAEDRRLALDRFLGELKKAERKAAARVHGRELDAEETALKKREYSLWRAQRDEEDIQQLRAEARRQRQRETEDVERLRRAEAQHQRSDVAVSGQTFVLGKQAEYAATQKQRKMRDWHHSYRAGIGSVKTALTRVLEVRGQPSRLPSVCQELATQVELARGNEVLFRSPDKAVNKALTEAIANLQSLATSCLAGEAEKMKAGETRAIAALAAAAVALKPYGLAP